MIDYKFSKKLKFSVIDHVVAPWPVSGDIQLPWSGSDQEDGASQ